MTISISLDTVSVWSIESGWAKQDVDLARSLV